MTASFTRSERLHKTREFRDVYKKGNVYKSEAFLLFVMSKPETEVVRLGLITPRKLGGAVKRNKLKRRLREIFRLNKYLIKPGYDIILHLKQKAINMNFDQLKESFFELLNRAKILHTTGSHQ